MSKPTQVQIDNLNNEIAIWNNFSDAVSELNNDDVTAKGLDYDRMVWTNDKVEYYTDHTALDSITQLVTKRAKIDTPVKFYIPNYNLIKGIKACTDYIDTQIENLQKGIDALKQNLQTN